MFFPAEKVPENGYLFEKNPCLVALSRGQLPSKAYQDQIRNQFSRHCCRRKRQGKISVSKRLYLQPVNLSFIKQPSFNSQFLSPTIARNIKSPQSNYFHQNNSGNACINYGVEITHLDNRTLESIPQWHQMFPLLKDGLRSCLKQGLECDIIYIQMPTEFLFTSLPRGSEEEIRNLQCSLNISILNDLEVNPEEDHDSYSYRWRSTITLTEPQEFFGNSNFIFTNSSSHDAVTKESLISLTIPVYQWAAQIISSRQQWLSSPSIIPCGPRDSHLFNNFDNISSKNIRSSHGAYCPDKTWSNQNYKHLSISMYQELLINSATNTDLPSFKKRAIILWSIHHPLISGTINESPVSLRYLLPPPPLSLSIDTASKDNSNEKSSCINNESAMDSFLSLHMTGTNNFTASNNAEGSDMSLIDSPHRTSLIASNFLYDYSAAAESQLSLANGHFERTLLQPQIKSPDSFPFDCRNQNFDSTNAYFVNKIKDHDHNINNATNPLIWRYNHDILQINADKYSTDVAEERYLNSQRVAHSFPLMTPLVQNSIDLSKSDHELDYNWNNNCNYSYHQNSNIPPPYQQHVPSDF